MPLAADRSKRRARLRPRLEAPKPSIPGTARRTTASEPVAVLLSPRAIVAPVGSEVILLVGVRADNYLRMNERVEWTIAGGSVGQFVELDTGTSWDLLLGDFTLPRKVSPHAVGSAWRRTLRLTRGTPTPSDDVLVARGQTSIAVS